MIEFNGYISEKAEKHFRKKGIILGQNIMLFGVAIILPIIILLTMETKNWLILFLYCSLFIIIPILVRIPKGKKEQLSITPKRIFIDGDYIICVADKYTESRLISDAKQVNDFGDFYEILFPFGKISEKFICQKNLLTKGTLGQFEALFEGKIHIKIQS